MTQEFVLFERVSYRYETMPDLLLQGIGISLPPGWTGIVGANGAGKTTVLKLACGLIEPRQGRVHSPENALYCAQRTDHLPGMLPSLIEQQDKVSCRLKGQLGIGIDWAIRWHSLSHGERKRAQIAVAIWQQPAVLALDEPTNHIDSDARKMLISALCDYRGIGLLVSHDRELLDMLCRQCLFLDRPEAVMRPGSYSSGRLEALREEEYERNQKELAKKRVAKLKAETERRMSLARNADRKRSKNGLALWDHDSRYRINLARFTGKDGQAGELASRMQSRLERARKTVEEAKVHKRYELGIWIDGERCKRDTLFQLYPSAIPLGNARELRHPGLVMFPGDRIALTGPNGSGKSMLVCHIMDAIDLPPGRLVYLPQEIDMSSSRKILEEVRRQPPEVLGKIMTIVSRLGSRPAALLESVEPSPGETRKLLLALGMALLPYLIIMDEPTNHLDLPSIECLEEALAGCPCGLLLVSHDKEFLRRLTNKSWHIARNQRSASEEWLVVSG